MRMRVITSDVNAAAPMKRSIGDCVWINIDKYKYVCYIFPMIAKKKKKKVNDICAEQLLSSRSLNAIDQFDDDDIDYCCFSLRFHGNLGTYDKAYHNSTVQGREPLRTEPCRCQAKSRPSLTFGSETPNQFSAFYDTILC